MSNTNSYEWVKLPSKGKCYPSNSPLRKGKIAVAYLTAKDEDIIMNNKIHTDRNIIDLIIQRKIINKEIDASTLVTGDRDAILLWLRRTGYGNEYTATVRNDTEEGEILTVKIDLSTIKNREFLLPSDNKGHFSFFMKNGDIIKFKYLTNKEISDIKNNISSNNDDNEDNMFLINALSAFTVSINDNEDMNIISQYIKNMTINDSFLYQSFIENNVPGVDTVINVEVSNNEVKTILLQIDENILMNIE